jgi:hypothetical protein
VAAGRGQSRHQFNPHKGIAAGRRIGQKFKRKALQSVARQNRRRLIKGDMQRRLAMAQRVIVHAGQIVMDQRIDMDRSMAAPTRTAASRSTPYISATAATSSGRTRLPPPIVA